MNPLKIMDTISLANRQGEDPIEIAMQLERKLTQPPWRGERQDNRLHFQGGTYSESAPGWRELVSLIGPCWLEVQSEPELALAYRTKTGELLGLTLAVGVAVGLVFDAAFHSHVLAALLGLAVWIGLFVPAYRSEARRLRAFLTDIVR